VFECVLLAGALAALPASTGARPPIRADFFSTYPSAVGTRLDALPSNSHHCGACHYDFSGGGARNPYGLGIEIGRNNGLTNVQAILAIANTDSDGDGAINAVEITDTVLYSNTPTFPGLHAGNAGITLNIPLAEITPYLTPAGSIDVTPPAVAVAYPQGGEAITPNTHVTVVYSATDASGVSRVDLYLSDDGGVHWRPVGKNETPGGAFDWFVPNLPGADNRIRIEAFDNAGNAASAASEGSFTILPFAGGRVPTTLRDVELAGTQPFRGAILNQPQDCATCHGNYDPANEPWQTWRGSMMAQAVRDPLFQACMAVAEQDAPSVGDLCIRCHSPGGWQEGRSTDTSGGMLNTKDREGVQCDFCHRSVDFDYVEGVSPAQDTAVLAALDALPLQYGNGQFVTDPAPLRRGPFADAAASHDFVQSPLHVSSNICGTCHDVSNPVFIATGAGDYAPAALNEEHPDGWVRNMFPVERTFSEWSQSAYAAGGVYAPQFAGNRPDGMVASCQDCHMRDVDARGCNESGSPRRPDLPLHDLTGGNTFVPDLIAALWPGETDAAALADAKARALGMLQKAATLELTPTDFGVVARVVNETGHKLPSGYPEGRRIWLHVVARDAGGGVIFESGAYDSGSGVLTHDAALKVYELHAGLSPALASALGMPAGPSFHFVLSDSVYLDNRIPPRGFTNAGFALVQSPPVGHTYADGQYWDDTPYVLPSQAATVTVTLYYQTTSKEYVEFLRDENVTNDAGQVLYDAWAAHGMGAPVVMQQVTIPVDVIVDATPAGETPAFGVERATPNPFVNATRIAYTVAHSAQVRVAVYDVRGRLVRMLVNEVQAPGRYSADWNGRDAAGVPAAAGIYWLEYRAADVTLTQRVVRLR
jgi:hypothetical protein